MDRVSHLMGKVLKKRGLGVHATAAHVSYIASQWLEQHFPDCSSQITIHSIEHGILHLAVTNAVIEQKLQQEAHTLQEFIQNSTGFPVVEVRISQAKRVA